MLITAIKAGRFAVTLDPLQKLLTRCDVELGSDADHCVILTLWLAGLSLRLEEPDTSHALIPRLLATAANDASPLQQSASANYAVEVLANENRLQDHGDLLAQVRRIAVTEALPPRTRSQAFLAMAIAELRSENLAAAIDASQAAIDLQSSLTHPDIDMLAKARLVRGLTRHRQAAFEPALGDIDRAITEFGRALGADHPLVALYRCNRAAVLRDLKRRDDAVQSLESSLHIVSKSFGDAPVVHRVQALLAELRAEPQNASRQSNVFVPFL